MADQNTYLFSDSESVVSLRDWFRNTYNKDSTRHVAGWDKWNSQRIFNQFASGRIAGFEAHFSETRYYITPSPPTAAAKTAIFRDARDSRQSPPKPSGPLPKKSMPQGPRTNQANKISNKIEVNELPEPVLEFDAMRTVLGVLAASTVWMPKKFVQYIEQVNQERSAKLLALHPRPASKLAKDFFLPGLAIGYPFVRRVAASERKRKDWLHRFHDDVSLVLDDNRMPKALWTWAWRGTGSTNAWTNDAYGFRKYQASHILPHKRDNHEDFFESLFVDKRHPEIDPHLLFLAAWNNLLVDKRVAGLTDNSPVVTAVLLNEAGRRYDIPLDKLLGPRKPEVLGINIATIEAGLRWREESCTHPCWETADFHTARYDWLKGVINEEHAKAPVPAEGTG